MVGTKKGVSPIIATVLLLMMTVAAAGAAYFWFSGVQGNLQSALQQKIGGTVKRTSQSIRIAYTKCDFLANQNKTNVSIIIQNTGTQAIKGSFLLVLQKEDQDIASNESQSMNVGPNSYSEEFNLTFSDGGQEIRLSECPKQFSLEASISQTTDSELINCSCPS